ncbi:MAG: 50S ribosomal protein L13 [Clostridia bacterium]|nr:50S ribosomal protein L13 [Clostridia bacterium]
MAKPAEVKRRWYILDAADRPLGRLASEAARLLAGKHKASYTPHVDTGDHVIVLNAARVRLTGKKAEQKAYVYHTHYPGGLRKVPYKELLAKKPEQIVTEAVRRMLPQTRLGRKMLKKLKVYRGSEHPHQAQQPEVWSGWRE